MGNLITLRMLLEEEEEGGVVVVVCVHAGVEGADAGDVEIPPATPLSSSHPPSHDALLPTAADAAGGSDILHRSAESRSS